MGGLGSGFQGKERRTRTDELPALTIGAVKRSGVLSSSSGQLVRLAAPETAVITEHTARVTVNLQSENRPHSLIVETGRLRDGIGLAWTRVTYGLRPWFICSGCGRRAGTLYVTHELRCRRCAGLSYSSQSASLRPRLERRVGRLRARLRWREWMQLPLKPSRMSWAKYATLVRGVLKAESLLEATRVYGLRAVRPSRMPPILGRVMAPAAHDVAEWKRLYSRARANERRELRALRKQRPAIEAGLIRNSGETPVR